MKRAPCSSRALALSSRFTRNDLKNLKTLEDSLGVKVTTREGWVKIDGEPAQIDRAERVFQQLEQARQKGVDIQKHEFSYALNSVTRRAPTIFRARSIPRSSLRRANPRLCRARRPAQLSRSDSKTRHRFWDRASRNWQDLSSRSDGRSGIKEGTGKPDYPDEAGGRSRRSARFLPGDLQEKITPYLRPLYDALRDMLEPDEIERNMARQTIEVAPLAYMRGRTLSNAFVILDEAQNTTTEQMFMLLTRMGPHSKCVVTGDVTQVDLPTNKRSGLVEALQALKNVTGISFIYFTERDVVRHELVRSIINAYQVHRSPANAPSRK